MAAPLVSAASEAHVAQRARDRLTLRLYTRPVRNDQRPTTNDADVECLRSLRGEERAGETVATVKTRTVPAPDLDDVARRRMMRRAIIASAAGTTIEWYDFFLYGVAAALVFPRQFFPGNDPYTGTLLAFSTYFVGFV